MIIPVDKKYRISSDRYQWILQEYQPHQNKEGKTVDNWSNIGHYSKLEHVINACFDLKLRLSDAEGIAEAAIVAKNAAKSLQVALSIENKGDNR